MPDAVVDTTTNQDTHQLADGSWYLHVRTRDVAGNWNAGASHFGPYKIDTTPPTDPTVTSASHTPNAWSVNPSVVVSWSGASDGAGSGVAGYSILWDAAASTLPDTTVDTTGATASSSRPDGVTYFHLRTKDVAGNWTSTVHFGPLKIDTTPPTNPTSFTLRSLHQPVVQQRHDQRPLGRRVGRDRQRRFGLLVRVEHIADDRAGYRR